MIILHQVLSALKYLHGQTPPIVHRDVKPENILVQDREPMRVKLADFGLSKASDYLKTLCGTHTYLAPEVARYYGSTSVSDVRYTNSIDICSLGVVIFQYAYGLTHPGQGAGLAWCEKLIDALNDWDSDGLTELLSSMLVIEPGSHESAGKCLSRAMRIPAPGRSSTPIPASSSLQQALSGNEDHETVVDCHVENRAETGQEDPLDSIRDSEIQGYIRSRTGNDLDNSVQSPAELLCPSEARSIYSGRSERQRASAVCSANNSSNEKQIKRRQQELGS